MHRLYYVKHTKGQAMKKQRLKTTTTIEVSKDQLDKVREVGSDMQRNRKSTVQMMLDFAYRMHKSGGNIFG